MNNILLTGASGFLATALKSGFERSKYAIIGLDRSREAINVDIIQPFVLDNQLQCDIIIHAAGKAHSVPRNAAEEKVFFDVNFEGTKNLCAAIERLPNKPKAFIFISTVAVYGVDAGEMVHEDHPLNGKTPYAESKVMAEQWLAEWATQQRITLGILRLPLVAGPNPPGNLGAMINGIKTGKYLSIGKANARKSVVWAEDIAHLIPRLAEIGGTYNVTDGYHPSFGELEKAISVALHNKLPMKVPYWFAKCLAWTGDVIGSKFPIDSDKLIKITSSLTFDDNKARKVLQWEPTPVLDKVEEMI